MEVFGFGGKLMKRIACVLAVVVSTVGLMAAGSANATKIYHVDTITFDGTLSGGTDTDGLFGPVGASLTGDAFELVASFDLSKEKPTIFITGGKSDSIEATLSINGSTPTDAMVTSGTLVESWIPTGLFGVTVFVNGPIFNIGAAYQVTDSSSLIVSGDTVSGFSQNLPCSTSGYDYCGNLNYPYPNISNLEVTAFSLTNYLDLLSVPEPGTWALMLIGFVCVGIALRHRIVAEPTSLGLARPRAAPR